MNPYVFIVGCPRSGTTLLRRIADAHRELAVMPEQHWLPRLWQWRAGVRGDGTVDSALLDMLLADRRFELLELPFKPIADLVEHGPPIEYSAFVTAIFDMYGARIGKLFVGEKTPKYVTAIRTLTELWPDARIVHLIRDGRDVALSLIDWDRAERNVGRLPSWADAPLMTAALYWEWCVRSGRDEGRRLGGRYIELLYEDLVADPEGACRRLCDFLGLAYEPEMLAFHEGRTHDVMGRSAKKSWQPITPGLRDWRRQMDRDELLEFEVVAAPMLSELGYERSTAGTDATVAKRAATARAAFTRHLARWDMPIPAAWQEVAA